MSEPKYDEDVVNLGYLKRALGLTNEETNEMYKYISRHYGSRPQPPYYIGDTWVDGTIIYTCVKERLIGMYDQNDWATESGAKKEVEEKNKVFLRQPSNYKPGDMWILQTDNDHKAGKKGEMLISTAGRAEYDEDDWINMLGYGTIRSINEVANNIKDALTRLNLNKDSGILTIFYAKEIPENPIENDLWYVLERIENYEKGKLYKYNGTAWEEIQDKLATVAFEEANEARLVEDGKIQSFYSDTQPIQNLGVGDIWTDTQTKKLYRYNGTKWVAVYDTNISEIRKELNTTIERTTTLETDLGEITARVSEIADIAVTKESNTATLSFLSYEKIDQSEPIKIEIHPIETNISYLYPRDNLYPSNDLFMPDRILRFKNTTTNEAFDYELPDDLLYYDAENYDEFILDYNDQKCTVKKKVGYNADGTTYVLQNPRTIQYPYPRIELTEGDYTISLPGYNVGYLSVKLMQQNIYTNQFVTKTEERADIRETSREIDLSVNRKLENYSTTEEMNGAINVKANQINLELEKKVNEEDITGARIMLAINNDSSSATINADKISFERKRI